MRRENSEIGRNIWRMELVLGWAEEEEAIAGGYSGSVANNAAE